MGARPVTPDPSVPFRMTLRAIEQLLELQGLLLLNEDPLRYAI